MSTTTETSPFESEKGVRTPAPPISAFRRFGVSAFTLVEMMIVIGILAVLVTLALTTASSVLADSRAKQTKATMHVIEAAIEQFVRDNPFANNPNVNPVGNDPNNGWKVLRQLPQTIPNPNPPPDKWIIQYKLSGTMEVVPVYSTQSIIRVPLFERYPPCPTAAMAVCPDHPETFVSNGLVNIDGQMLLGPPYPATKENDDEPPAAPSRAETEKKLVRLINVMKGFDIPVCDCVPNDWLIQHDPQQPIEKYASIECLVFALREFSPAARSIIDKLPSKVLVNLDKDFAFHDTIPPLPAKPNRKYDNGEEQVTLYEVLDAWKQPIRYAIREAIHTSIDPSAPLPAPLRWELRSAGADGVFAPPFTEESRSDDVILQGQ